MRACRSAADGAAVLLVLTIEPTRDDEFQLAGRAQGYAYAARAVYDKYKNYQNTRAPILHLIAHGFEVSMKAALVNSGIGMSEIKGSYGHDLWKLYGDL